MGVLPYATAMAWLHDERACLFLEAHLDDPSLSRAGCSLQLDEQYLRYRCPPRQGDAVEILTSLCAPEPRAIRCEQRLIRTSDGILLVEASSLHHCVSRVGRFHALPGPILAQLRGSALDHGLR